MEYFVKPKSVRLDIGDGQFIDVKARLNTGETHELYSRMRPHMVPGEKITLQSEAVLVSQVLAYLVGWSLTDNGEPVPMSPTMSEADRLSVINSLELDVFNRIKDAIDKHTEAVETERIAAKNAQSTASVSPAI